MTQSASVTPIKRFFGTLTGADELRAEMRRLEAFLSAVPGEYCGFSSDGSVVYSPGFLETMGLNQVETIYDIQNILKLSDAALFEGLFNRLQTDGDDFSIDVESSNGKKFFNLSGSRGSAISGKEFFNIIWLKDITAEKLESVKDNKNIQSLTQKTNHLKTSFDYLPVACWIKDDKNKITWCNKPYAELFDTSEEDILKEQKEVSLKSKDPKIKSLEDLSQHVRSTNHPQAV